MALLDVDRQRSPDTGISHWVFDGTVGRICARDSDGNLVMALAAGPLFGSRLAAAFRSLGGIGPMQDDRGFGPRMLQR